MTAHLVCCFLSICTDYYKKYSGIQYRNRYHQSDKKRTVLVDAKIDFKNNFEVILHCTAEFIKGFSVIRDHRDTLYKEKVGKITVQKDSIIIQAIILD